MKMTKTKLKVLGMFVGFSIASNIAMNIYIDRILDDAKAKHQQILDEIEKTNEEMKEIEEENNRIQKAIEEERERKRKEKEHKKAIDYVKNVGLSLDHDLVTSTVPLTAEDIDQIIDEWVKKYGKEDSVFIGHGSAFIKASEKTGLNPIYLLAHAIVESDCGTSYYAKTRFNFFGINAVDTNPDLATAFDSVDDGIINGAVWIYVNFYKHQYTSLRRMQNAPYASDKHWSESIVFVANKAAQYL